MKISQPLFAFVVLLAVHTLVSLCAYQFLTVRTRTALPVDSTPIKTTTEAERARGESSFRVMTGHEEVVREVPYSVTFYIIFGYAAFAVAFALALVSHFRHSTP